MILLFNVRRVLYLRHTLTSTVIDTPERFRPVCQRESRGARPLAGKRGARKRWRGTRVSSPGTEEILFDLPPSGCWQPCRSSSHSVDWPNRPNSDDSPSRSSESSSLLPGNTPLKCANRSKLIFSRPTKRATENVRV